MTVPPLNFFSPGVKIQELNFSAYSTGTTGTVAGIIGIFAQGPIAQPALVTSLPAAQKLFGNFLPSYYGMYAVKQFFDNGGQQLYIVRTAHYSTISNPATLSAISAALTLVDRAGSPLSTISVAAVNQGTWANGSTGGLSIAIANGTLNPTTEFQMQVFLGGLLVETWDNLSMSSTSSDYFENVVNGNSQYVLLSDLASVTSPPNNLPALISAGSPTNLAGGNDGLASLGDSDIVGDPNGKTGLYAFNTVSPLNLVGAPGHATYTVASGLITYVQTRADCFAVIETPSGLSQTNALAYRAQTTPYSGVIFDSTYAALYWPWLNLIDPVTNLVRVFPISASVMGLICASDQVAGQWAAPAGYNRGVLSQVVSLEQPVDMTTNDAVYPFGINIPLNVQNLGFVIMGQKTLHRRTDLLNRINVRRMLLYVEQTCKTFGATVLFQPNTALTRSGLARQLNTFLATLQSNQGIDQFVVICDNTNNSAEDVAANRLNVTIAVVPTTAVEFITFNIQIYNGTVQLTTLFSGQ